jgi:hypothetical protein
VRAALVAVRWLGVVALTLVLGELAARFVLHQDPLQTEAMLWRHHPRWGWAHIPDADGVFVKPGFSQAIHINSKGLREREIPYEKPRGVTRILVLGDSSVVGFEVPEEAVFTRVAEAQLRERGYTVEFINAGVRGYGTDQSLLFLEDEGLRYAPDLVLYKWTDNDRDDNATVHRPFRRFGKPYFDLDGNDALVLRGAPVPDYPYGADLRVGRDGEVRSLEIAPLTWVTLWFRDVALTHSAFATALLKAALAAPSVSQALVGLGGYDDGQDLDRNLDRSSRLFRVTVAMVREMQRLSEAHGAQFRMIGATGPWGGAVREEATMPELGSAEHFRALIPPGASLQVRYDPHWNELGHRLYGEALADSLAESGLLQRPAPEQAGND